MKRFTTLLIVACLVGTAGAADWSAWTVGNSDQIGARFCLRNGRTEIGIEGMFAKEAEQGDNKDGYSLSAVALWEAVPSFDFPIGGLLPPWLETDALPTSVPVGIYVGAKMGYEFTAESPVAGLIAGFRLNPEAPHGFGLEYQFAFDEGVWSDLPNLSDRHQVMLVGYYRF